MVDPAVLLGALDGHDVARALHHADGAVVAVLVGADLADLPVGQVLANRAGANLLVRLQDGVGKLLGLVLGEVQHIKGEPLGRLAADARQAGKLLDQAGQRQHIVFHRLKQAWQGKSAGDLLHLGGVDFLDLADGLVDRADDHVLQNLDVLRVNRFLLNI